MIETRGMIALVEATDAALKAANVSFLGSKQVGAGCHGCGGFGSRTLL